jgi:hypothetical protein
MPKSFNQKKIKRYVSELFVVDFTDMASYKDPHKAAAASSSEVVIDEVTIWQPGMYDPEVTLRVPIFEMISSKPDAPPASIMGFETPNRLKSPSGSEAPKAS